MRITVFGMGYVGCVTATCLARDGHHVIGVDVNASKLESIVSGRSPVKEAKLDELIARLVHEGRLTTSMDAADAVSRSEVSMICVGTPSNANGSLKLEHVVNVCRQLGAALKARSAYHVVVVRSTVLPGTVRKQLIPELERASGLRAGKDFGVCMNPEFLREGSAVDDYDHPSQIVIGELDAQSGEPVEQLYAAVDAPVIRAPLETAEMVKYVNNAFHALKVSFANEIGNLCKSHGIDGREVMEIFCRDRRLNISPAYLKPGFAFGGSCLPKDLRALIYNARENDLGVPILEAVLQSNQLQLWRSTQLVESTGFKKIGVLGLSFKAGTDDVRESPTVGLVETLVGRGYDVRIYDGNVDPDCLIGANRSFLERELPHIASLMRSSVEDVVAESEVVVIANGDKAFRSVPGLLSPKQCMIDLVGVCNGSGKPSAKYEGICW